MCRCTHSLLKEKKSEKKTAEFSIIRIVEFFLDVSGEHVIFWHRWRCHLHVWSWGLLEAIRGFRLRMWPKSWTPAWYVRTYLYRSWIFHNFSQTEAVQFAVCSALECRAYLVYKVRNYGVFHTGNLNMKLKANCQFRHGEYKTHFQNLGFSWEEFMPSEHGLQEWVLMY